ncbi:MAG: MBL fold metallo-hydrolase [Candidatus Woesearchaeota archaeon]
MGLVKSSIMFLGTAGDIIVAGKQLRSSGGIVLTLENNQFLLDPGPGCLNNAAKLNINLRETIAIFSSNMDILLSNDVNAVVAAATLNGMDRTGVFIGAKSVTEGENQEQPVLMPRYKAMMEKVITISPNSKMGINDIDIYSTPTKTSDKTAVGFKFTASNFTVGYTGCTELTDQLIESMKNCDILIINCKNPADVNEEGQMNIADAITLVKAASPRLVILTYFGKKMIDANPLAEAREIKSITNVQAIAANDGLIIDPTNYALGRGPKRKDDGFERHTDAGIQTDTANTNKAAAEETQTTFDEPAKDQSE